MPITLPAVWCPAKNPEFEDLAPDMIFCFGSKKMHGQPLWGDERPFGKLGQLAVDTKLYLMCHCHSDISKFSMGNLAWTGEEMAALLQRDGLVAAHRHIELIVCNAGASLGSQAAIARFRQIQAEFVQANKRQDQAAIDAAVRKYNAHKERARAEPQPFTRPGQQIPLAGDLFTALYGRGYRSLVVTGYLRQVSMVFTGAQIELDVPPKTPAIKVPHLAVSWRA